MKANHVLAKATIVAVAMAMAGCATQSPTMDKLAAAQKSVSSKMTDLSLEREIKSQLAAMPELANARVMVDVFRGYVLLTGEVPSEAVGVAALKVVDAVVGAGRWEQHLSVTPAKLTSHTLHEKYLRTKVLHHMRQIGVDTKENELVVRNDVVYLMGEPNAQKRSAMINMLNQMGGIKDYADVDVAPKRTVVAPQNTNATHVQATAQPSAYSQNQYAGQPAYNAYSQNNAANQSYYYTNTSVPPSTYGQNYNNQTHAGQSYGNHSHINNASSRNYRYTVPNPAQSDYVRKWKNPRWAP